MAEQTLQIDIGFHGGQVLPLRVQQKAYDGLRKALDDENSKRWYELKAHDSDVAIDLAQVVYVRLDTEAHRVGF
jgi:hypothetical protein